MELFRSLAILSLASFAACQADPASSGSATSAAVTSTSATVTSQTPSVTTVLPPPPAYSDGDFIIPDTSIQQIFTLGNTMNVTWTTDYPAVNLWLIQGTNYNSPFACTTGTSQTWWIWTVDDHGNNSMPFSFRAVDADGSTEDQQDGGFYTGQFWISAPAGSSTVATTSTNTGSRTHLSGPATSLASTSSSAAKTGSATATHTSSPSSSNTVAIGAGVGVGVGCALILGAVVAWWAVRRRNKRKELEKQTEIQNFANNGRGPQPPFSNHGSQQWANNSQPPWSAAPKYGHQSAGYPPYNSSSPPPPSELANHQYYEAPSFQQEPRELPGSYHISKPPST